MSTGESRELEDASSVRLEGLLETDVDMCVLGEVDVDGVFWASIQGTGSSPRTPMVNGLWGRSRGAE